MRAPGDRSAAGRSAPARQASLRRLAEFGVRPNRDLGQNFLADDNLLRIIGELGELDPADVVLEVGGGLGVLSEHLAPRVSHLHVIEIDSALEPALNDALGPYDNVSLHLGDAVTMSYEELRPAPEKVIANLPYGVAATVLLKSIAELPGAGLWVAMVQREVAERFAAPPGGRAYGAPSAIAQLACSVRVARRVPASVFVPVPRVESALCVLRRTGAPPRPEVVALVHAAFAHRRKTLAGSLALVVDDAYGPAVRAAARAGLEGIGRPADARAERLAGSELAVLAEGLEPELLGAVEDGVARTARRSPRESRPASP